MLNIGIRELEAQIATKKRKIASIKERIGSIGDAFTQRDELLIEILEEAEFTNRLLVLTNRILFASLKAQSGGVAPVIEGLEDISGSRYRTRVIRYDNVKGDGRIFTLEGAGIISEIELVSSNSTTDNKTYSVRLVADDNIIYNDSWDNFNSRNMHEADMSAFDDTNNDKYILLFQDIAFDSLCYLELYENSATFEYINVKYHEKIGVL